MAMAVEFIDIIISMLKAGHTAFLMSFNTDDRYFEPGEDETPLPFMLFIADKFPDHDVGYFSLSTKLMHITRPGNMRKSAFDIGNSQSGDSLIQAISIVRGGDKRIIIIDFMSFLAPNASEEMLHPDAMRIIESLVRIGQDDELRKLNSFVIGVNHTKNINGMVRRTWCHINIPLPDEDLRKSYYQLLSGRHGFAKLDAEITDAEYASLSRGCRLRDIENVLRQAEGEGRSVTRDDFNAVRKSTLNSLVGDMLVIRQPSGLTLDDIYGMDAFKGYIRSLVKPVKNGRHSLLPGGIFLIGPPGTGKTYLIDAIATEFGYHILEYSNPKESLVGQSEENIDNAIQSIKSNNPVLVSVDEADQILSQRQEGPSGDSGVSAYIFARLLAVMGDPSLRGRVIWVLCSNRPDLVDPSLVDRIGCSVPISL